MYGRGEEVPAPVYGLFAVEGERVDLI